MDKEKALKAVERVLELTEEGDITFSIHNSRGTWIARYVSNGTYVEGCSTSAYVAIYEAWLRANHEFLGKCPHGC